MIRVLICDGDGTLGFDRETAKKIIDGLNHLGIQLAVASNKSSPKVIRGRFAQNGLQPPGVIVTKPPNKSFAKPNPQMVTRVLDACGVERHEVAFLGDSDKTDIFCAINAGILPLAAKYSNPEMEYGIPMEDVDYLLRYLELYCTQDEPYFGWRYSAACEDTGTQIDIRALIDQHSGIDDLKGLLKGTLDASNVLVGPRSIRLSSILINYLITRLFLNGDIESGEATIVVVYPGHAENARNKLLVWFAEDFKHAFRSMHEPVLIRHSDAPQSAMQRTERNVFDQFRTIQVDPEQKHKVEGKHIIILDDYTTHGYSFETARRMLLKAGARKVTCVAIGKWQHNQCVTRISRDWNPYQPCRLNREDIVPMSRHGQAYPDADSAFKRILRYLEEN